MVKNQALYSPKNPYSVLQQTQQLHREIATAIDLRECMRVHKFATKQFHACRHQQRSARELSDQEASDMLQRLNSFLLLLEYYELVANTLVEQQENLLNLVRYIEATFKRVC
jgi:hypothetical protein